MATSEHSPTPSEQGELPKPNLQPLGLTLLGASLLYIFLLLTNVAVYLPRALGHTEESPFAIQMLIYVAIIVAYNVFLLFGACAILLHRGYAIAFLSCCFAVIPMLGPCWLLGIPIGVWGILTLLRKDVRDSFTRY